MRTIAIVNQKGGCGKTTTAINLSAILAKRGMRTLLLDMDPQGHCAAGLGVPEVQIEYNIGDALLADHNDGFDPAPLLWEVGHNLVLAPSTMRLAALEAPGGGLHQLPDKDRRLESLLSRLAHRYDCCLIDCPPTVGLLTFNALRAAREALIPVETGFFAWRGAEKQWSTIQRVIEHIGRPIACHLMATLFKPESKLARTILASLRRQFAGQILPVVIREHELLREAASYGQPIIDYAADSDACDDYEQLADWLCEHATRPPAVEVEVMARHPGPMGGTELEKITAGPQIEGPPDPDSAPAPAPGMATLHPANPAAVTPPHQPPHQSTPEPAHGGIAVAARTGEGGSRAAELAARVRHRQAARDTATAPLPESDVVSDPTPLRTPEEPTTAEAPSEPAFGPPLPAPKGDQTPSYGVHVTEGGVRFVQPGPPEQSICVAGDFNLWSPTTTPLPYDRDLDAHAAEIDLPAGRYQYRLIVDGRWLPDPYNEQQQRNTHGELNSVVIV